MAKTVVGTARATAQGVVHQLVPKLTPRLTKRVVGAQARANVSGIKAALAPKVFQATTAIKGLIAKLAAPVGALSGSTVALALGAGIASFAATTALLNAIKGRKERKAEAAFQAARAYRAARLAAAEELGRDLTGLEQQGLAAQFKAALAATGFKP